MSCGQSSVLAAAAKTSLPEGSLTYGKMAVTGTIRQLPATNRRTMYLPSSCSFGRPSGPFG
eukprot:8407623-Prorocentrum_lima.AAC.1